MRVISRKALEEFWQHHPDARRPLLNWYRVASAAEWRSLDDVRRIYPHADAVTTAGSGALTVFNIGGNKHRLVMRIRYDWRLINIRCVLTHADYDRGDWRE